MNRPAVLRHIESQVRQQRLVFRLRRPDSAALIDYVRHLESKGAPAARPDGLIKRMVDRFLGWRLPENFRPDCGIQFDADAAKKLNPLNRRYEPMGTNLFDATQAEAMVRHMIDGPTPTARPEALESPEGEEATLFPYCPIGPCALREGHDGPCDDLAGDVRAERASIGPGGNPSDDPAGH